MLRRRTVQAGRALQQLGVDPLRLRGSLRGIPTYVRNRRAFLKQAAEDSEHLFAVGDDYPVLVDRYDHSGVANGHYFHQDLLVAQMIHRADPKRHVDVGSRVDGFVAHVAAFREVDVLDIRPLRTSAARIKFVRRDITLSDPTWDDATDSLSCLHTLEHVGLGRYGDRVDYYGYLDAWKNLTRMLRPGGILYFSVPIGAVQRIEFDAHRIFSVPYLTKTLFEPSFDVESLGYVDDLGELHPSVDVASGEAARSFELSYGCGVFALRRRQRQGEASAAIQSVPGSLQEALAALRDDHDYLLEGGVFTKDLIETWIDYKQKREVEPVALRPHPWEFYLYHDA